MAQSENISAGGLLVLKERSYETFGEWVKHARNVKGWSQAKLAGRSFCSLDAIRKIEQNRIEYRPSLEVATRLADCLEIQSAQRAEFIEMARAHGEDKQAARESVAAPNDQVAPLLVESAASNPASRTKHWLRNISPVWIIASIVIGLLALLAVAAVLASMLVLWQFSNFTTIPVINSSGALELAPQEPRVRVEANGRFISNGDTIPRNTLVTVTFTVVNPSVSVARFAAIAIGSRGPCAEKCTWDSRQASFAGVNNLVLQPGQSYTYRAARLFMEPGNYFVEPVKQDLNGKHGGIQPFTRIEFTLAE